MVDAAYGAFAHGLDMALTASGGLLLASAIVAYTTGKSVADDGLRHKRVDPTSAPSRCQPVRRGTVTISAGATSASGSRRSTNVATARNTLRLASAHGIRIGNTWNMPGSSRPTVSTPAV